MALSIGELVGYLRIDDSGVEQGLNSAEGHVQGFKAKAAAAGALAGGALGAGFSAAASSAVEFDSTRAKLQAQMGLSAEDARKYGDMAGRLYANAYGGSVAEAGEAVSTVVRNLGLADATEAEIERSTQLIMSYSDTFGTEVNETSRAVGNALKTGIGDNAEQVLDVMTRMAQQSGDSMADLADTVFEYSGSIDNAGLSIEQFGGIVQQAMGAGAPSIDKVGDSIAEMTKIVAEGSKPASDALSSLGLNASQVIADMAAGGPRAAGATDQIFDAMRKVGDTSTREAARVAIFAGAGEDMADALYAIDPSSAVAALGDVAGAASKVDAALGDSAEAKVTKMQNSLTVFGGQLLSLPGPLGDVATGIGAFGPAALSMGGSFAMIGVFIGPLIAKLAGLATSAASTAAGFIASMARVAASVAMGVAGMIADIARWVVQVTVQGAIAVANMARTAAAYLLQWTIMAAQSVARAAAMAAAWAVGVLVPAAGALVRMAITAAAYILQWVIMAAGSMASAVAMAAAWVIAMGPVGWIIAAVVALVALIIANWDTVSSATVAAWNAVSSAVSTVVDAVVGFVQGLVDDVVSALEWFVDLHVRAAEWFGGLVSAAIQKGGELLDWVLGLPGEILSALGDLGSLLLDAGKDVVTGLWNGILGAGRWLWDKIMGWAKQFIPGPILQFLGIASPSKWMRDHVGRWIPEGIGEGIIRNARAAADAARKVAVQTAQAAQVGALSGMTSTLGAPAPRFTPWSPSGAGALDSAAMAAAVRGGVMDALDGSRMQVDGRGVARLVNRQNLIDARRSITPII